MKIETPNEDYTEINKENEDQAFVCFAAKCSCLRLVAAIAIVSSLLGLASSGEAQTWTLTGAPSANWVSVASSADGVKLAAAGWVPDTFISEIYTSSDSGVTWTLTSALQDLEWVSIASSADGTKLVAAANEDEAFGPGPIYVSADSGATWSPANVTNNYWGSVASSADGNTLVAAAQDGPVYVSTNGAVTWTMTKLSTNLYWTSVASSADGTILVAAAEHASIYVSTNSGLTWNTSSTSHFLWASVACSSDGSKMAAAAYWGLNGVGNVPLYTSANSGATWVPTATPSDFIWSGVASSGDGSKLVAVAEEGGPSYISTDSGTSWIPGDTNMFWRAVASSLDGNKIVAVVFGGGIYTYAASTTLPAVFGPVSQTVAAGSTVTFNVAAYGLAPLAYQWLITGMPLGGETNAALTLFNVGLSNSGVYSVQVSNATGGVLSEQAVLTVLPSIIATQPAENILDTTALLVASVIPGTNETSVWFQWGMDTNYANETQSVYAGVGFGERNETARLQGLAPNTEFHFRAVASNVVGMVTGDDASFVTMGSAFVRREAPTYVNGYGWTCVACSADGARVVAGSQAQDGDGPIYMSTNAGMTWTKTSAPLNWWGSLASSADGTKLAASISELPIHGGPGIYTSTNSGGTWKPASTPSNSEGWFYLAGSADCSKLSMYGDFATSGGGTDFPSYESTDSGETWALTSLPSDPFLFAYSADGTRVVAGGYGNIFTGTGDGIYTSTDSGASWALTGAPITSWKCVASSADGNKLAACAENSGLISGTIYTSVDAGVTWAPNWTLTNANGDIQWSSLSMSSDGTKLVAVPFSDRAVLIYTSSDSGVTWIPHPPATNWVDAACSADGNLIVAASSTAIYTLQTTPTPSLTFAPAGTNVVFSWGIPSIPFTLQQSPDLANWTDVSGTPTTNFGNLHNEVTLLPPGVGSVFYRLKH